MYSFGAHVFIRRACGRGSVVGARLVCPGVGSRGRRPSSCRSNRQCRLADDDRKRTDAWARMRPSPRVDLSSRRRRPHRRLPRADTVDVWRPTIRPAPSRSSEIVVRQTTHPNECHDDRSDLAVASSVSARTRRSVRSATTRPSRSASSSAKCPDDRPDRPDCQSGRLTPLAGLG